MMDKGKIFFGFAATNIQLHLEMHDFFGGETQWNKGDLSPNASPYPQLHTGLSTFAKCYDNLACLLKHEITS